LLIASSGATILSDSIIIKIDQEGFRTFDRKFAILIENQLGREYFGDIEIRYNSELSEFEIVEAYTESEDGKKYEPEEEGISDLSAYETYLAPMYSKNRLKVVSFKKVNPGAKIHYHYRIKSKVLPSLPFSGTHAFKENFPIKKKSFSLILPDTMNIIFNIEPDRKLKEENYIRYLWKRENLPRIRDYNYRPPDFNIAEELIYSSVQSWEKMGASIYDILRKEIKPIRRTKEINQLYSFVKDSIRTIPIPLSLTGLTPLPPKEIIKNKYGCSRDKSILLVSLLKGAKYDAAPALICGWFINKDEIYKTLPTLSPFYYLAAAVNTGDSILFFDPSCKYCGSKYVTFEGKTAWVIKQDTSYFYKVPEAYNNEILVDSRYEVSAEGDIKAKITAELNGCFSEMFQQLFESDKENIKKKVLEYLLSEISVSAKADTIDIDMIKDVVRIKLVFESPRYATKQGKYITMKLISNIIPYFPLLSLTDSEDRTYPYYFDFSNAKLEEKTIISYPESFELSHLPENKELLGEDYLIKIQTSSREDQIRYIRKVLYNKGMISEKTNFAEDIKKFLDKSTLGVLFREK
jgi:hypothetical protein